MKLAQLWLHESERIYSDRLVSLADQKKYKELAIEQSKKYFKEFSPTQLFADPLIFCHFAGGMGEKMYDKATSFADLSSLLAGALSEYNEVQVSGAMPAAHGIEPLIPSTSTSLPPPFSWNRRSWIWFFLKMVSRTSRIALLVDASQSACSIDLQTLCFLTRRVRLCSATHRS